MAMAMGRRATVGGGWFYEVALASGETVLRESHSRLTANPWLAAVDGKLYLTNHRLIWVRAQPSIFPWFRRSIEIDLRDVRVCRIAGGRRWFLNGQALAVRTETYVWRFSLVIFLPSRVA